MEFLFRLYNRIFGKVKKASIPSTEKEQIMDVLNDMINQVETGTAKIDDQISELNEINRIIDKAEERAKSTEPMYRLPDQGPVLRDITKDSSIDEILADLAERAGTTPDQARTALVNRANEAYPPGDPKRMRMDDDVTLEAYAQSKIQMGEKDELLEDVIDAGAKDEMMKKMSMSPDEFKDMIGPGRPRSVYDEIAEDEMLPFGRSKESESLEDLIDNELSTIKQRNRDIERAEELMMNPDNFGKTFDEIMQMVQDEKVIPFKPKKKATGGRVQLKDGGGPKLSRRSVLQMMGAGIGSLMMPRGAKKVADAMVPAVKKIVPTPGMPDWFPLLAQQIKTKGKVVREPEYADFTSGGDTTVRYELKDKSLAGDKIFLEEDMQTGVVSIYGRGDDYQQVSMDYIPGSRTVDKKGRIRESEPTFEAGEFFKGEIRDVENFGGIDEMQGDLGSWVKLSGVDKTAKKQLEEVKKLFKEETKDPNIEPDEFAQGGGVGSLFKRKA